MYVPGEHPEVDVQVCNLWQTFGILEEFGTEKNIQTAFDNLMETFGESKNMLTAMDLVLNWKLWEAYHAGKDGLAQIYDRLWKNVDAHALDVLKDDELRFYVEVTD